MKKFYLVLGAALIALSVFSGCKSTNSEIGKGVEANAQKYGTPKWFWGLPDSIVDESKGIYGVGISSISNLSAAQKSARLDARAALASRISIVIQGVESRNEDANCDVYKGELKGNVNQLLVGSKQVDMWFGDIEGTKQTGVLMFMPYEDLLKSFKNQAMKSADANMQKYLDGITIMELMAAAENLPSLRE